MNLIQITAKTKENGSYHFSWYLKVTVYFEDKNSLQGTKWVIVFGGDEFEREESEG